MYAGRKLEVLLISLYVSLLAKLIDRTDSNYSLFNATISRHLYPFDEYSVFRVIMLYYFQNFYLTTCLPLEYLALIDLNATPIRQ